MFSSCSKLSNCTATISNNSIDAWAIGFYTCNQITNCISTAINSGGGVGYGYANCSYGSCNKDGGSTTAPTGGTMMTKWSSETND